MPLKWEKAFYRKVSFFFQKTLNFGLKRALLRNISFIRIVLQVSGYEFFFVNIQFFSKKNYILVEKGVLKKYYYLRHIL